MNRLLNTSSMTGSAFVPMATRLGSAFTRFSTRCLRAVSSAPQPSSTTVVLCASTISAGPFTVCPGFSLSRSNTGALSHLPPAKIFVRATGFGFD